MNRIKRAIFSTAVLTVIAYMSTETALAACNSTVNGRPMTRQECATAIQVYGRVVPGNYLVDTYGNWVNINNPMHRGNTYNDARRRATANSSRGGSWGGGSYTSPRGVYDSSGGCEGGSCVNIID